MKAVGSFTNKYAATTSYGATNSSTSVLSEMRTFGIFIIKPQYFVLGQMCYHNIQVTHPPSYFKSTFAP